MKMTRRTFLSASALTLLSCQLAPAARADCLLSGLFHGADTALPPKPLTSKVVDANPFMGRSESNIHHDCYNTDSTDAVLPIGICPEVNVAMEKELGGVPLIDATDILALELVRAFAPEKLR